MLSIDGTCDSNTLKSDPRGKRGKAYREFFGAIACTPISNSQDCIFRLFFYDTASSSLVLFDEVNISPGKSYVWNHEDYGIKLEPEGYIQAVAGIAPCAVWLKTKDRLS
ncbi:MAG: hypothetical protein GOVbin2833_45 [Prokaryotic dsDNA virus sp.]|nr:MAG: hypothetical protein GOVbin2833_45 [Prokaryotic dsDNA virus sp.]